KEGFLTARTVQERLAAFGADMQKLHDAYDALVHRCCGFDPPPANPFEVPSPPTDFNEVKSIADRYLKRFPQIGKITGKLSNDAVQERQLTLTRLVSVLSRRLILQKALIWQANAFDAIGEECGSDSPTFRLS